MIFRTSESQVKRVKGFGTNTIITFLEMHESGGISIKMLITSRVVEHLRVLERDAIRRLFVCRCKGTFVEVLSIVANAR